MSFALGTVLSVSVAVGALVSLPNADVTNADLMDDQFMSGECWSGERPADYDQYPVATWVTFDGDKQPAKVYSQAEIDAALNKALGLKDEPSIARVHGFCRPA